MSGEQLDDGTGVRVMVRSGWAVFHIDRHRTGGEVVEVDAATAQHWTRSGWADLVPAAEPGKPSSPARRTRVRTARATPPTGPSGTAA